MMITTINDMQGTLDCIKYFLETEGDKVINVDDRKQVVTLRCEEYISKFRLPENNFRELLETLDKRNIIYNRVPLEEFDVETKTGRFKLNSEGVWDSDTCYECCSDCSACEEECVCPVVFEGTCSNCIFKEGYKKCSQCFVKPRTTDERHYQTGFWHMCDECITKCEN